MSLSQKELFYCEAGHTQGVLVGDFSGVGGFVAGCDVMAKVSSGFIAGLFEHANL